MSIIHGRKERGLEHADPFCLDQGQMKVNFAESFETLRIKIAHAKHTSSRCMHEQWDLSNRPTDRH